MKENWPCGCLKETARNCVGIFHTRPVIQHGAQMKEYVEVPDILLNDLEKLIKYIIMSYELAASLKPK